jgi:hypothetical protein
MKLQNNNSYSTEPQVTIFFAREDDGGAAAAAEAARVAAATDMQKKIDDAVAAATTGLKAKNDELLGKLKDTGTKLKLFDGLDAEKIKEQLARLDLDEDLKLFSEGKKHEVIEKHTQRMRQSHLEELAAKDTLIQAEAKRADAYRGAVLDSQILSVTAGLHKGAVEDALLHARNLFTLDANGKAVQMDNGTAVLGKDGKTPFGPAEWIEQQKELKPHWFPAGTSGGGSGAAREASGNGKTISRADFDALSPHAKAAAAQGGIKITD